MFMKDGKKLAENAFSYSSLRIWRLSKSNKIRRAWFWPLWVLIFLRTRVKINFYSLMRNEHNDEIILLGLFVNNAAFLIKNSIELPCTKTLDVQEFIGLWCIWCRMLAYYDDECTHNTLHAATFSKISLTLLIMRPFKPNRSTDRKQIKNINERVILK